jgi:hypothetical protein
VSIVLIRWIDPDTTQFVVDGRRVFSASDLDEDGGREGEPSVAWTAEQAAEAVARALGATVTIERPTS